MKNLKHLESIRLFELEIVLDEIQRKKPGENIILEIGAGSGWQAKKMSELGHVVQAIDLENSNYSNRRVWPITNYDGKHIPFSNEYFDILFSSNVLEHIFYLDEFLNEMKRVLKPDGIAIHLVPSSSWRLWTNLAHYPYLFRTGINIISKKLLAIQSVVPEHKNFNIGQDEILKKMNRLPIIKKITKVIFPSRHGEVGNLFSEMYYFSQYRWINLFEKTGWVIEKQFNNELFYTGYEIIGSRMSMQIRRYLSYILGSSCHIFVLRKVKY